MTKKYVVRLRSSDGEYLRPNEYHSREPAENGNKRAAKGFGNEVCDVTFKETKLNLHQLCQAHPNGKWSIRCTYFNIYCSKGLRVMDFENPKEVTILGVTETGFLKESGAVRKCAGIDIIIDQFNSPYVASSNPTHGLALATANCDIATPTDETFGATGTDPGPNTQPVAFTLENSDACSKICHINRDGFLTVRLRDSVQSSNDRFSRLVTIDEGGQVQRVPDFVLELELTPYYDTDHREY